MRDLRPFRLWLLAALLFCATAGQAQTPVQSPSNGPWRTISQGDDSKLMLEGHDAVAYFTENQAIKGDPAIKLEYKGVTWRFASVTNRATFEKSPGEYMPQFGGYCANGINYAIPGGGGGGPNTWRIYRGKLYVFGGQSARDHFEMETEVNLALAHKYWNESLAGGDARQLRSRFMSERVPHYKTDRALNEEYAAKLAAKILPVMPGMPQVVPAR